MVNSGECGKPGESWTEARERAERESQNRQTAPGSAESGAEDGETPPADSAPGDGDPSMATPEYGGPDRPACPECGNGMRRAGSGLSFEGKREGETVHVTTGDDDWLCDGCNVLADKDKEKIVTNVK